MCEGRDEERRDEAGPRKAPVDSRVKTETQLQMRRIFRHRAHFIAGEPDVKASSLGFRIQAHWKGWNVESVDLA